MKSFFKKLFGFISIFIILNVLGVLINSLILNRSNILKLSSEKTILILGDSNTECAINDSVFQKAINLSYAADSYFYSYLKLKKILEKNPKIKTVILSFAYHNILKSVEQSWIFNSAHIKSRFGKYYSFMEFSDILLLIKSNPMAIISSLFEPSKETVKNVIKILTINRSKKNFFLGGYRYLIWNKLNVPIEKFKFEKSSGGFNYSKVEKDYLEKIVALCKNNNVHLFLVNTPKHKNFIELNKNYINNYKVYYKTYFSGVRLLDFSNYQMPDSCFGDFTHLNYKGAKVFSEYLNKLEELN